MKTMSSVYLYTTIVIAAGVLASAQIALAQTSDAPVTRSERKAQTRAANKSGELPRAGEAPLPEKGFHSSKTRGDRKAQTIEARQRGELLLPGEANYKAQLPAQIRSDKTRAERKAETLKAAKEGTLLSAGEADDPARLQTLPRRQHTN